jgi:type IV secretory pathway VirB10-like protein
MKEPRRLLSQGATDFERQLLRAVVNERPSALLRSRMQRGLGLVGPLAWASTVKAMLGSVAGKVTGVVALGVLVAAGVTSLHLVPSSDELPPVAQVSAPTAASVSEPAVAPALRAPAAAMPAESPGSAAPAAPPTASPSAPELAARVEPEATDDDDRQLREEIALLDAARGALERGEREAARSSLRSYRERFPTGILAREANVLRRRAEPAHARPRTAR